MPLNRNRAGIAGMLLLIFVLIFAGCELGEDNEGNSAHNSGSNCQACHGFTVSATIYKDVAGNGVCNSALHVRFLDPFTKAVVYDSAGVGDSSSGGNFFIRSASLHGNYDTQIISGDGAVLAVSALPHSFTTGYNGSNPSDLNNRYSCNACHTVPGVNGAAGRIYVQQNINKCP